MRETQEVLRKKTQKGTGEVLFSHKKERSTDTHYRVDEPGNIMLSERSQTQKDKHCMIPFT